MKASKGIRETALSKVRDTRGVSFLIALVFMMVSMVVVAAVLSSAAANAERINQHAADEQAYFSVVSAVDVASDLIEGQGVNTIGALTIRQPSADSSDLRTYGYSEGADKTGLSDWAVKTAQQVYEHNAEEPDPDALSPLSVDDEAEDEDDEGFGKTTWTVTADLGSEAGADVPTVNLTLSMNSDYSITMTVQAVESESEPNAAGYSDTIKKSFVAHSGEKNSFSWGEGSEIVEMYTVTFDPNGGNPTPPAQTVPEGDTITDPGTVAREGYTFVDGWFTEPTGGTPWNFETDTVSSDMILYAHWTVIKHTVTFKADGAEPAIQTKQVDYNTTVDAPTEPTKDPDEQYTYTFAGWYLNGAMYNFSTPVTEDITLEAQWTQESKSQTDPTFNPGSNASYATNDSNYWKTAFYINRNSGYQAHWFGVKDGVITSISDQSATAKGNGSPYYVRYSFRQESNKYNCYVTALYNSSDGKYYIPVAAESKSGIAENTRLAVCGVSYGKGGSSKLVGTSWLKSIETVEAFMSGTQFYAVSRSGSGTSASLSPSSSSVAIAVTWQEWTP